MLQLGSYRGCKLMSQAQTYFASVANCTQLCLADGRRDHPDVQACSVWSFPPGEYRDRGVVRWNGCRVDYMIAGGTLTLDPIARPGHAPMRGSPAAGSAAGAAPESQRAGVGTLKPSSADVRGPEASPASASDAPAQEQVHAPACSVLTSLTRMSRRLQGLCADMSFTEGK